VWGVRLLNASGAALPRACPALNTSYAAAKRVRRCCCMRRQATTTHAAWRLLPLGLLRACSSLGDLAAGRTWAALRPSSIFYYGERLVAVWWYTVALVAFGRGIMA